MTTDRTTYDGSEAALRTVVWRDGPNILGRLHGVVLAQWKGECSRCGRSYAKGDLIFIADANLYAAVDCCATEADYSGASSLDLGGIDLEDDSVGLGFVPLSQVMPPRRSKADMCGSCFQIPAANGICGC